MLKELEVEGSIIIIVVVGVVDYSFSLSLG